MKSTVTFCILLCFGLKYNKSEFIQSTLDDIESDSISLVYMKYNYDKLIYDLLRPHGIGDTLCKIIIAQSMHETANFTSNVFLENNNLFGMKCARKRDHCCVGTNRKHAVYNTIYDSIEDFVIYMEYVKMPRNIRTVKEYVRFLKKSKYFEDKEKRYLKGVEYYYNSIKHKNYENSNNLYFVDIIDLP